MSRIEQVADTEKENIIDKTLNTKPIRNALERSMNRLFGAKIENEDEYTIIADLRKAMYEIPRELREYYKIFKVYDGTELDIEYLNLKGTVDRSLPFYDKYISGNNVEMIFNSKADKVINSGVKYETTTKETGSKEKKEDIFIDRDKYKEIEKMTSLYERCAMHIMNAEDGIDKFRFNVLEPYRYIIRDNKCVIFTLMQPYKTKRKEFTQFEVIECYLQDNGKWTQQKRICYIDDKDKTYKIIRSDKVVETDKVMIHEIHNDTYKSDLSTIKQSIYVSDMIETIRAVELKLSQFSIHADQSYFENGKIIVSDVYRILNSEFAGVETPLFQAFQPELRIESYIAYKDDLIEAMSLSMGMSARALGLVTVQPQNQVATIAILDEEKTAETINNKKSSLKRQLDEILAIYFPDYTIAIPEYVSQSMPYKVEIVSKLRNDMSISEKVKFLYPTKTKKEIDTEVILIKFEQSIPMTAIEQQRAVELNILTADEIAMENNVE